MPRAGTWACSTRGSTWSTPRESRSPTSGLTWPSGSHGRKPGASGAFPIETVSQSEGGFEGVYQSSAVVPHWHVTADESGRWDVRIRLAIDSFKPAEAHAPQARRDPGAGLKL